MDEEQKEQAEQIANLKLQLEAEKKRSEEYLTRLRYLQADFENLKKRSDRQIEQVKNCATECLVIQLLDVVDELEMAIKTAQTAKSTEKLTEGVQMTLKKMHKILEQEGVSRIDSEGKVFDPTRHNAIATVECDEDGCVVVEEVRKGYMMKNKAIRPSIVKVSVKSSSKLQNKEEKISE